MRIIGGLYRSRLISMPKGAEIRPTQDKVRQAIFNILQDVSGKTVLELFAGSGAFGIEAISRGARHVTFVENNNKCVQTIAENLDSLKVEASLYRIIRANALEVAAGLEKKEGRFDLVFLDPPYHQDLAKKCLISIDAYDIVAKSALVVVEHYKREQLPRDLHRLNFLTERAYSDTLISIYRSA
jgi:16S rRNA (guanine966-N2)-methyltransferase